jgi:hypothetical protein
MADYTVDKADTLGEFLIRKESLQPWRLSLLITAGAVSVLRGPAAVTPLKASMQLLPGDKVSLQSPLPVLTPAAGDFIDYCFVPGNDKTIVTLQSIMEHRPQSKRLTGLDALDEFIDALSDSEITKPIRHLYIGSHANDAGDLFMRLQSVLNPPIEYEMLELAEKNGKLKIDPKLIEPRPQVGGQAVPAQLRVRGCRIGKAKPFLAQLKKALGGGIAVNAPKHFEHVAEWDNPDGVFEYMDYDFQLRRTKAFGNDKEALAAFVAAGFTDIDGKPIPAALLKAGIPVNVQKQGEQSKDTTVKVPFASKPFTTPLSFRYHHEKFRPEKGGFPLPSDPVKQEPRKALLKKEFLNNPGSWPLFDPKHPFPEWMRLGYSSFDEFMDGYVWRFDYDASTKTLYFNGDRHVYDLLIPITESGTTNLICNFYPTTSNGKVIEKMDAADKRFYETS